MLTIFPKIEGQNPDVASGTKHVPVLDGLRGIAILLVLGGHFYQRTLFTGEPTMAIAFGRLAVAGAYGVELFFVLSGFLITGILIDNKDSPGSLRTFYIRRCLRIFPLYYLSLTFIFLALPRFVQFDQGAELIAKHQLWLWTYMVSWPSPGWIWDDSNIFRLGHFWSLSVEEHFYLFWPGLVYLLSSGALVKSCILLVGIGFVSRLSSAVIGVDSPTILQWATLQKIDGLAIGALLAVAVRDSRLQSALPEGRTLRWGLVAFTVLLVCYTGLPRRLNTELVRVFSETVVATLCGLVVLMALRSSKCSFFSRFLSSSVLTGFGKYSYGLYVIHGLFRPQFDKLLALEVARPRFPGSPMLYQFVYYMLTIGISFAMAYLSYHLFEKHFLAMKRYVPYKGENQRTR